MSKLNVGAFEGDTSKGVDSLYDALVELDTRTTSDAILNAKGYGVVGDGVTDDTAAVLALLTLADGRPVYFPAGIYVTDGLSITQDSIHIYGDGIDKTIFLHSQESAKDTFKLNSTTGPHTFKDLTIDGNNYVTEWQAIHLGFTASDILIERVKFLKSSGTRTAIKSAWSSSVSGVVIKDCIFEDCKEGGISFLPQTSSMDNIFITGNLFLRCGQNIMQTYGDPTLTAENKWHTFHNFHFDYNSIIDCPANGTFGPIPVEVRSITGGSISYNVVDSGTRGLTATAYSRDLIIEGNVVKNQHAYSIEAGSTRNVSVKNNIFNNTAHGITFTPQGESNAMVDNFVIQDNIFEGSGLHEYEGTNPPSAIKTSAGFVMRNLVIKGNIFKNRKFNLYSVLAMGTRAHPYITFDGAGDGNAIATCTYEVVTTEPRILNEGSNYGSTPIVTIYGAGGSGATATATVDTDTGRLTSATVTASGSGYEGPVTVMLTGGGEIVSITGISIAAASVITISPGTFFSGMDVTISGTNATPDINGRHELTWISATEFSIPINVTDSGTGTGTAMIDSAHHGEIEFIMGIDAVTIVDGGASYTDSNVNFSDKCGGFGATATYTVVGGVIQNSVSVTAPGSYYARPSSICIEDNLFLTTEEDCSYTAIRTEGHYCSIKRNTFYRTTPYNRTTSYVSQNGMVDIPLINNSEQGYPKYIIEDNIFYMTGEQGTSNQFAVGNNSTAENRFGNIIKGNTFIGNYSTNVISSPSTSTDEIIMGNDFSGVIGAIPPVRSDSGRASGTRNRTNSTYSGVGIPTTGYWTIGDIINNINFATIPSDPLAWICLETGSPGTWSSFGTSHDPEIYTQTGHFFMSYAKSGCTHTSGTGSTINGNLPVAIPGLIYTFELTIASAIRVIPNGTETFRYKADQVTAGIAGDYILMTVSGTICTVECKQAGIWEMTFQEGTFADETP